ncbi:hypothetical protein UU5_05246 [Rhodanobacter sp. 115]|nr:hypothetical protein UU5_05246 [Rhodanobacter sp. 115]
MKVKRQGLAPIAPEARDVAFDDTFLEGDIAVVHRHADHVRVERCRVVKREHHLLSHGRWFIKMNDAREGLGTAVLVGDAVVVVQLAGVDARCPAATQQRHSHERGDTVHRLH